MAISGSFMKALLLILVLFPEHVIPATLVLTNNCAYPIWPGLLSSAGTAPLPVTGFLLNPGKSQPIDTPPAWSGRLWGRTRCSTDPSTGSFSCASADCGTGTVECSGRGATPPATLAEFTLDGSNGMDFFDVSLVDGYNVPMLVTPQGSLGGGRCGSTGCLVDLNGLCPSELRLLEADDAVGCRSACEAFGTPEYCCSGVYGGPDTCKPSAYSQLFKNACPRAYSYAYDDATSTFTCSTGTGYAITFCPSSTSLKSSDSGRGTGGNPQAAGLPVINDTMVFLRGDISAGATSHPTVIPTIVQVLALLLVARWLH